jgi:CubicO group peptidase (beta-lactamase class C family)
MLGKFARRAGVASLLSVLGQLACAAPADLGDPQALEAFIDGVVKPLMKDHNSPSGVVAMAKDGELLFAKGYGYQDVEKQIPVNAGDTLFRPGSVSKLFTWVSVMQLVEQGKLDLDTDVNTWLENFQIADTFDEPVTLRDIMTHTAGFEDGSLGYLIFDDPERIMPLSESMARYQPARVNPPGTHSAYSNYATSVAGLIVANVSGLSFNEYVRQNIFEPLGMKNATFEEPLPESLAGQMAKSYTAEAGRFVEKPFEIIANFGPAGSLSASGTDMLRFAQAVLDGGELDGKRMIGADTLDTMLTRAFSHDDRLMGMALGFYEEEHNGIRLVGHGGDTQYFHSYLGIDHENDLAFFVSFSGSGGSTVRSAFTPAFYNEYFPAPWTRPEPPADFADTAGRYAGTYGFWRNNFSKIEKALGLSSVIQVAPTEDGTLMLAFGGNAKQYVQVDDNLFQELNPNMSLISGISPPLMAFQEDESGEITGFVLDGLPFMSLRKLPLAATPNFNFTLLGFSLLVFILVLLRRFYQRAAIRLQPPPDRAATNAAVWASAANVLVVVAGVIVISIVKDSLFTGIPFLFKAWLVLPIVATVAGLYLLYRMFVAWRQGLLGGTWPRLRYTVVALCALFMCWFYWYWNILGFQYYT